MAAPACENSRVRRRMNQPDWGERPFWKDDELGNLFSTPPAPEDRPGSKVSGAVESYRIIFDLQNLAHRCGRIRTRWGLTIVFSGARTVTSGSSTRADFDGDECRIGHRRQVSLWLT
jgi:hypothetical protein